MYAVELSLLAICNGSEDMAMEIIEKFVKFFSGMKYSKWLMNNGGWVCSNSVSHFVRFVHI